MGSCRRRSFAFALFCVCFTLRAESDAFPNPIDNFAQTFGPRAYTFMVRSGVECRRRLWASLTLAPESITSVVKAPRREWKSTFPSSVHFGMPTALRSVSSERAGW